MHSQALCGILLDIDPFTVDAAQVLSMSPAERIEFAFSLAHETYDVPRLLDVEMLTDYEKPDDKCVMLYVSGLYKGTEAVRVARIENEAASPTVNDVDDAAPDASTSGPETDEQVPKSDLSDADAATAATIVNEDVEPQDNVVAGVVVRESAAVTEPATQPDDGSDSADKMDSKSSSQSTDDSAPDPATVASVEPEPEVEVEPATTTTAADETEQEPEPATTVDGGAATPAAPTSGDSDDGGFPNSPPDMRNEADVAPPAADAVVVAESSDKALPPAGPASSVTVESEEPEKSVEVQPLVEEGQNTTEPRSQVESPEPTPSGTVQDETQPEHVPTTMETSTAGSDDSDHSPPPASSSFLSSLIEAVDNPQQLAQSDDEDPPEVVLSGGLLKQGKHRHSWRKRFVILRSDGVLVRFAAAQLPTHARTHTRAHTHTHMNSRTYLYPHCNRLTSNAKAKTRPKEWLILKVYLACTVTINCTLSLAASKLAVATIRSYSEPGTLKTKSRG